MQCTREILIFHCYVFGSELVLLLVYCPPLCEKRMLIIAALYYVNCKPIIFVNYFFMFTCEGQSSRVYMYQIYVTLWRNLTPLS